MQLDFWPDDRTKIVREIHERLVCRFGPPGPWFHPDPVSQLVLGLIGGRTYEAVSLAAFKTLALHFRSWEAVRDAPVADIQASIRRVTFADVKAARLQQALICVEAKRGQLELDFLRRRDVASAMTWLMHLPGVGPKVAALILNFSTLRMPALVVDTHHLRVLRRLGMVRRTASATDVFHVAMSHLPASWTAGDMDDHHQLMKGLGQGICRHRDPACRKCPLLDLCPTGQALRLPAQPNSAVGD